MANKNSWQEIYVKYVRDVQSTSLHILDNPRKIIENMAKRIAELEASNAEHTKKSQRAIADLVRRTP